MKMWTRLGHFGLVLCIAASPGRGAPLTPHGGWVFVAGGQDMIQAGQWSCVTGLTVSADTLSVPATSSGYNTVIDTSGPVLQVSGDFSVLATLSDPGTPGSFLTMVGTLNTGSLFSVSYTHLICSQTRYSG